MVTRKCAASGIFSRVLMVRAYAEPCAHHTVVDRLSPTYPILALRKALSRILRMLSRKKPTSHARTKPTLLAIIHARNSVPRPSEEAAYAFNHTCQRTLVVYSTHFPNVPVACMCIIYARWTQWSLRHVNNLRIISAPNQRPRSTIKNKSERHGQ